jgi:hypothetical protein
MVELVDTLVLETSISEFESRLGYHADMMELVYISDLKSEFSEFESRYPHQVSGVSIMDNTVGFYPSNGSSILSRRTKFYYVKKMTYN